ncbi:MAG TPA: hypothetical protein GX005_00380, partial [Bacteroidales bacterium]|nr:hypothetical protein [Bacteroidales bacterium]
IATKLCTVNGYYLSSKDDEEKTVEQRIMDFCLPPNGKYNITNEVKGKYSYIYIIQVV